MWHIKGLSDWGVKPGDFWTGIMWILLSVSWMHNKNTRQKSRWTMKADYKLLSSSICWGCLQILEQWILLLLLCVQPYVHGSVHKYEYYMIKSKPVFTDMYDNVWCPSHSQAVVFCQTGTGWSKKSVSGRTGLEVTQLELWNTLRNISKAAVGFRKIPETLTWHQLQVLQGTQTPPTSFSFAMVPVLVTGREQEAALRAGTSI